jgi:hypothetical protein
MCPLSAATVAAMELKMLTALVLICSVAATPDIRDCARANATAVLRVPAEFANPMTCLMHGQAYLAQTSLGEELQGDDHVKVVCARSEKVDASIRLLTVK